MKSTKKNASRKTIFLACAITISVALITTGFAVWTISNNARHREYGDMKVASISDSQISIYDVHFNENGASLERGFLNYGPRYDDNEGRVRSDNNELPTSSNDHEHLTNQLVFTVDNTDKLPSGKDSALTLNIGFNEDALNLLGYQKDEKKALSSPSLFGEANTESKIATIGDETYYMSDTKLALFGTNYGQAIEDVEGHRKAIRYTVDITFEWGELFNFMNPGDYYDIDPTGKEITFEEMKETLSEFHNLADSKNPQFLLQIEATLA